MKTLSIAIVFASFLTATVMAQPPAGGRTLTPADPATVVQNRVARLTRLLSLTSAQSAQATTIFTNELAALAPLQTSLTQDRQSMTAAVKSNATGTIDALAASIGTLTGQMLSIESKADAAFYAILTTDQQAKVGPGLGMGMGMGRGRGMMGMGPGMGQPMRRSRQ